VGVGHDQNLMFNTKRNSTDTFTIAERALFKTVFHTVPQFTPACSMVGINEGAEKTIQISIFPNPSSGKINISSPKKGVLMVRDLLGKTILTKELKPGNTIIALEEDGIYLMMIDCDQQRKTFKVVIQR
jgi:hypothetical protein